MRKKKSTQQLVGIERVTDSSVLTAGGELTFYLVQPTNLNVLPESGVRTRVTALLNVLKTSAEMELLSLDSKESYGHENVRRHSMGETNITIKFDAAKLDALEFVLRKQRSSVQRRMVEMLQQLYESEVPEAVREYVDSKATPVARPKRPVRAAKAANEQAAAMQQEE